MAVERMDDVRFEIARPADPSIEIRVNGRPLQEHAADIERDYDPSLAGSYAGLSPHVVGSIHHYLGRPRASWFQDGDTVLLGCDCGEWGCWPLTAVVVVMRDTVRWSGFRTGHRDWDLGDLGPFEFARHEYVRALGVLGPYLPE
ncbi:hypothetical protein L2K70_15360 [Nocardioides KLBMP 9356]|uniref:Uncharacterized protein n=1 Tax=Nocardioides potassii TaxID=2911371 RepID=A0ABS9HFJ0_9ACTN|nr:hypothetical protein [Nocardioides potassii]MCF6378994.1 hypothetical protein [Nocardioides potassii]